MYAIMGDSMTVYELHDDFFEAVEAYDACNAEKYNDEPLICINLGAVEKEDMPKYLASENFRNSFRPFLEERGYTVNW